LAVCYKTTKQPFCFIPKKESSVRALLHPITRRVGQRLLVFVDPNPIAHVDVAAAARAFPVVLGLAQWPPGHLPLPDDDAARKWIFHARDFI
jgi:hypothetical protein